MAENEAPIVQHDGVTEIGSIKCDQMKTTWPPSRDTEPEDAARPAAGGTSTTDYPS